MTFLYIMNFIANPLFIGIFEIFILIMKPPIATRLDPLKSIAPHTSFSVTRILYFHC